MENEEMDSPFSFHTCKFCPYKTKSYTIMYNHTRLHRTRPKTETFKCESSTPELLNCDQCEFETVLKVSLHNHISVFHEEKEAAVDLRSIFESYECEYCDFQTSSSLVLLAHACQDHSEEMLISEENFDEIEPKGDPNCSDMSSCEDLALESREWFEGEQCSYTSTTKLELGSHVESRHNEWFKCADCLYQAKSKRALRMHITVKHMNITKWLKCDQCPYKTIYKKSLKEHIDNKHSDCRFECKHCSFKTKFKSDLRNHLRCKIHLQTVSDLRNALEAPGNGLEITEWFECGPCSFKTKYKNSLMKHRDSKCHLQKVSKVKPKPKITKWLQCEQCQYKTGYKIFLEKHMEAVHSVRSSNSTPRSLNTVSKNSSTDHLQKLPELTNIEWFKCEQCPYQTVYKLFLDKHVDYMHSDHCFECKPCSFRTKSESTLHRHFRSKPHRKKALKLKNARRKRAVVAHNMNTREWFKCEQCSFKTVNKDALKQHFDTTHPIIWFECEPCGFKTNVKISLKNHLQCKSHLQMVSVFEWFQCEHCPYKTTYKIFLEKHVEYLHSVGWFECNCCSFKTKHKSSLYTHMRSHRRNDTK